MHSRALSQAVLLLLLLSLMVAGSQAQITGFTAEVAIRSVRVGDEDDLGVQLANLTYSWDFHQMRFDYTEYSEVHSFDPAAAEAQSSPDLNPFNSQLIYRFGSACDDQCEFEPANYVFPVLYGGSDPAVYTPTTTKKTFPRGICTLQEPTSSPLVSSYLTEVYLSDGGTICSFATDTGIEVTIVSLKPATPTLEDFDPPTRCVCQSSVDVILVLDRSSSISRLEFVDQKLFVEQFTAGFDVGANKASISIINFGASSFTNTYMTLLE
eukprot:TRINITY_DN3804_c0_g1_i1.p2 TRINITY_DN3804_c0_g1~~TRINITY_DN3804_c0_g1_i1.p2  ORF type:complete len:279 (+),score=59.23 TRINITY_DN3804_c0_g1_i1:38-838(+)